MISAPSNLRGIAAMVFATASFVVCDSFMKLATEALPPFEVLFLRGVAATACCTMLLLVLGQGHVVRHSFNKAAVLRACFETAAVLCYIVALSVMPIADVVAIVQTAPLLLIVLVASIWREKIGPRRIALIAVGFAGAVLVAQPNASGLSSAAALAFVGALGVALRDAFSRTVPSSVSPLAVTFSTVIIVMIGAGIMMLLTEDVAMPSPRHALYLLAAGLFVTIGHYAIFLAYRLGAPGAVAPFFYSFAIWAVVAGVIVFDELPNPIALLGIAAIVASGLGIVLLDRRVTRTPVPAVAPD
jgi:drug/metabolite transporter (DMT)-like permease